VPGTRILHFAQQDFAQQAMHLLADTPAPGEILGH
jgi:hypothetical protein